MNSTLDFVLRRYNIRKEEESPIRISCRRSELGVLTRGLGFGTGAEIGVDRGDFSRTLCQLNPHLKLYCIDPWIAYGDYHDIEDQKTLDANFEMTKEVLRPYNCEIIRETSMEATKRFKPESLDFVYIDGNHTFGYAKEDITEWARIVRTGGIIAGHDYLYRKKEGVGVKDALDGYLKDHNIQRLFLTSQNHDSSWFFVKE